MAIFVHVLVHLIDLVEESVVRDSLIEDVDAVANEGDDRNTARDLGCIVNDKRSTRKLKLLVVQQVLGEDGWKNKSHCIPGLAIVTRVESKKRTRSDKHETTARLGDCLVEFLNVVLHASSYKAGTKTEQEVGQD